MNRPRSFVLLSILPLLAAGCGYPWTVVRQTSPNPFAHQRQFAIEPMHFENLIVGSGTEADHLGDKDDAQRASWEADKAAMDGELRQGLVEDLNGHTLMAHGAAPFTMRIQITYIEPGFYVGVASQATEVRLTLFLFDARSGGLLDEIQFECREEAGLLNPSVGQRLRSCGRSLGRLVAYYVNERTGVE